MPLNSNKHRVRSATITKKGQDICRQVTDVLGMGCAYADGRKNGVRYKWLGSYNDRVAISMAFRYFFDKYQNDPKVIVKCGLHGGAAKGYPSQIEWIAVTVLA